MGFCDDINKLIREEVEKRVDRNSEVIDMQSAMLFELRQTNKELEAENARLRQQRDAANAQLDFILENTKCDTVSVQNVSSRD